MNTEIEKLEQAFYHNPADVNAFAALQRIYKEESRLHDLAKLFERRSAHLQDNKEAAALLWMASEIHRQNANTAAEVRTLSKAVELNPGHIKAIQRLKGWHTQESRWTEVLSFIALEIEASDSSSPTKQIAKLEFEAGSIWEKQFFRLDRAIEHYQRCFKADPNHSEAIESGRRIYRSLGHWQTVASLYQVELSTTNEAPRRAELLLELGQLQAEKLTDLQAAARSYTEASHLRPGDETILEALAEIYTSPTWPTPDGLSKATAIYIQIAQSYQSRGDREKTVSYLRRALGADPQNEAAYLKLEKTYEETGRWEDLDRLYRQRISVASPVESIELLMRRGDLLERKLGDRKGARECYELVWPQEPLGGPAQNRLLHLYRADKEYDKLLALLQSQLDQTTDRRGRISIFMEMAFICRDQLNDHESSAHLFHEVLQIEPENRRALSAYADYFRQKEDYRNLAELLRFAAQAAKDAGASSMEICSKLEELADISERYIGDLEGAIEAWQQIGQLHPDTERTQDHLTRLAGKLRMWQGMVTLLERDFDQARTQDQRLQALRRMAQIYFEKRADPPKTITLLRDLLEISEYDENALRMLITLYERESNYEGLAWALERKLKGIVTKSEEISLLQRLSEIYADKLDLPKEALRVLQSLIEINPTDSAAHARAQTILERTEDLENLVRFLEIRSRVTVNLKERIDALKTLSRLMDDRLDNPSRAIVYWEEILIHDSTDIQAMEALCRLYEKTERPVDLVNILRRRLESDEVNSPVNRANLFRQLGEVCFDKLNRLEEATWAYEQIVEILPGDREAIETLTKLYTKLGRYRDLVSILDRQISLADDSEQRVVLAFKQGDLLEEKLGDGRAAVRVYERIINEFSPGDVDAHQKLKQLYIKLENYQAACVIAERELFLMAPDAPDRCSVALEIAALWREKVRDTPKAVLAYERVLELDEDNVEALSALRELYPLVGATTKFVKMAQALFASIGDPQEKLALLLEIAQVYETNLFDPESAFQWFRRANDLYPEDPRGMQNLQRLARHYGLWEELLEAYQENRKHIQGSAEFLELSMMMATICREKLNDPLRGFGFLAPCLQVEPQNHELLMAFEELALEADKPQELYQVYDHLLSVTSDPETQYDLLFRKANIAENMLLDLNTALQCMIKIFDIFPENPEILEEIERLGIGGGNVEEVISLHRSRFMSAKNLEQKLAILDHVAAFMEGSLVNPRRAFRVFLHAFTLAPEQNDIIENLWRLATDFEKEGSTGWVSSPTWPATSPDQTEEVTQEITADDVDVMLPEDEQIIIEPSKTSRKDSTIQDPTVMEVTSATPMPELTPPKPPPLPPIKADDLLAWDEVQAPWEEFSRAYLSLPAEDRDMKVRHLLSASDLWMRGAHAPKRALDVLAEAMALDCENNAVRKIIAETASMVDDKEALTSTYQKGHRPYQDL